MLSFRNSFLLGHKVSLLTLERGQTSAPRHVAALTGGGKYSVPGWFCGKPQGLCRSGKGETRATPEAPRCSNRRQQGGRRLDATTLNPQSEIRKWGSAPCGPFFPAVWQTFPQKMKLSTVSVLIMHGRSWFAYPNTQGCGVNEKLLPGGRLQENEKNRQGWQCPLVRANLSDQLPQQNCEVCGIG